MSRKATAAELNGTANAIVIGIDSPDVAGMLARNVPTRLLDISRTGCLLESRQRVDDGTVGELQLQVQQRTFVDDVRVTRCVLVEGSGSVYRVGAEFVQTRRPGEHSIRRAIAEILRSLTTKGTIVNPVHSSREERS